MKKILAITLGIVSLSMVPASAALNGHAFDWNNGDKVEQFKSLMGGSNGSMLPAGEDPLAGFAADPFAVAAKPETRVVSPEEQDFIDADRMADLLDRILRGESVSGKDVEWGQGVLAVTLVAIENEMDEFYKNRDSIMEEIRTQGLVEDGEVLLPPNAPEEVIQYLVGMIEVSMLTVQHMVMQSAEILKGAKVVK